MIAGIPTAEFLFLLAISLMLFYLCVRHTPRVP